MGTHKRTYEQTHSWLRFELDLRRFDPELWLLLGEAQSKCDHITGVPLQRSTARHLHLIYLAKGVNATTAIEGNTLSEDEVRRRIEGKLDLPPSKRYMQVEVDNIVQACNMITQNVLEGKDRLDLETLKLFNRMILVEQPLAPEIVPGEIRTYPVGVGNYRAVPCEDCEWLVQRLCEWLNDRHFEVYPHWRIVTGLLKAALAHLYIAWIHPFGDGNGRTARLVEFQILLHYGVPTPAAQLLSNHYNQTRTQYYQKLDEARREEGGVASFVKYAVQGFVDGLKEQLAIIRQQQYAISWRDYVHEILRQDRQPSRRRMQHLVLDLSKHHQPVPVSKIREISARVTEDYLNKTQKTISRDINKLIDLGLVRKEAGGIVPNQEIILAFLPGKRQTGDEERA